ncbi:MAG: Nif3-like dinuclear metal center hexameric protein, partial [Victivallales bacterium]
MIKKLHGIRRIFMKAREITRVFETIAPLSLGIPDDLANRYMGLRIGSPDTEVKAVGVAWCLSKEVIAMAAIKKIKMLIIHEPGIFSTWTSPFHTNIEPLTIPNNIWKMERLMENGIVVYTAHTNWDNQQEVGMGPTVAKALGFTKKVKTDVTLHVYEIKPLALGALIKQVKSRMGLKFVRYQGNLNKKVRRVVLAWGSMGSELEAIIANEADAGIFGELREWPFIWARENNVGIIETTHLVS